MAHRPVIQSQWPSKLRRPLALLLMTVPLALCAARAEADIPVTIQIGTSTDDVNEVNNSFDAASSTVWLGNGGSTATSYTGLRFTSVPIPQGATITSAYLQMYSVQNQWISMGYVLGADASGNSPAFTASSRPSQRGLTVNRVTHTDDVSWAANTWYSLEEMNFVIQEVVNRADWQPGNSISFVLQGSSPGSWGRKFLTSYEGGPANAPRLVVSYSAPVGSPPTADLTATPASIGVGESAVLNWTTTNATSVSLDNGIGTVATSGSLAIAPAVTTTYTLTAIGPGGTATATATITLTAAPLAPIATLTASPTSIPQGGSSTLSWTTTNATTVSIDQGIGSVAASGSYDVAPTSTTTYTVTATNSSGSTTATATVAVTESSGSFTAQVNSADDDVNEMNNSFDARADTIWLGNAGAANGSYTGLRFNNVAIPRGASVTSAYLQVYSTQSQWNSVAYVLGGEAVGNSAPFTTNSRPSQRTLTDNKVTHDDDVSWDANTWYSLDDMKFVVQEIINRGDWQSGNAMSFILKGAGAGSWARKFVSSYEGASGNAARLIVSYTGGSSGGTMPTASITVSPAVIMSGGSATLSWTTTNATSVSIAPGIGPVESSGSLSVRPSSTTTYTISATNQSGSATQATTLTVNSGTVTSAYFGVSGGFTDLVPHQFIRTSGDLSYIFASAQPYSQNLAAYSTSKAGVPNGASDFDRRVVAPLSGIPISISPVYDGAATMYVCANLLNGNVIVVPYDLTTNTFGLEQVVARDGGTVSGEYIGTSGVSAMMDTSATLHLAYWNSANQIVHVSFVKNTSGSGLTPASSPFRVDASGSAHHPSVAVSPLDNSLTVAWVSLATTPRQILVRVRSASGVWGTVQTVSNSAVDVWTSTSAGLDIDQGPSMVITSDGVRHLTYIENYDSTGDYGAVHYVSSNGGVWTDDKLPATYSHDPAVATNSAGDLYIIGHGHPNDSVNACRSMDDICVSKRNADGTWSSPSLFAKPPSGQSFDSSPSVKWSVVGWNRPETIEFLFFQTPYTTPTVFYARLP